MSLTLEIEHRLKAKGFDVLYDGQDAKWIEMAGKAREYCETFITAGETIRPGDISENLQNAIKTDAHFEAHLKARKLTQKYWIRDFSDYILDKIYPSHITE
jgi:hypothetical protein